MFSGRIQKFRKNRERDIVLFNLLQCNHVKYFSRSVLGRFSSSLWLVPEYKQEQYNQLT